MKITCELPLWTLRHKLSEQTIPTGEATGTHPCGWQDGLRGLLGKRQIHGAELATKKTRRGERFEFLFFTDTFEPLPDIDEGWDNRIIRS